MKLETIGTPWMWAAFTLGVLALLALDLGVFHRRAHVTTPREALRWSLVWLACALLFGGWVYERFGAERGMEFFAGYLIEKALSVDNIFVFLVIFSYFSVRPEHQHRVLFWGVLGAIVLRVVFILLGAALLQRFHWLLYLFGALLVFTGLKLLLQRAESVHPERNPVLRLARRWLPVADDYHGPHFFVLREGRRLATPLLLVLLVVEATDVVFAVDSIPAIFAVTEDPFIVFTSNIFAILGLRALYFVLADAMHRLRYLKTGLGLVLAFVGVKMLIRDVYHVPIGLSLAVIAAILGSSAAASLLTPPAEPPLPQHRHDGAPAPPFPAERRRGGA